MPADISFDNDAIRRHLRSAKTIAVVGLSDNPARTSYGVARYMQNAGYRIIPVNPMLKGPVLGEPSYATLADIPPEIKIDIIDVFRRSEDMPPVAAQARVRPAPLFWMQLGIANDASAAALVALGMDVIQDRCIKIEHAALL
jgi:predicted CoA-binding protein